MSQVPTPASVARPLDARRYQADLERARAEGKAEGRAEARKEFLNWLNKEYLKPNVQRGGEKGQAILQVTRDLSNFFNRTEGQTKGTRR